MINLYTKILNPSFQGHKIYLTAEERISVFSIDTSSLRMAGERTWRCEGAWVAKESSLYSAVYKNCGMQVGRHTVLRCTSSAAYKYCGIQVVMYTASELGVARFVDQNVFGNATVELLK